ncbi:MAG TPA: hypothetical protein VKX46_17050 [Ktedonobacteraceae bacterium]|nr:hypothetical protein [Ktedonobacteraceae bacterium]
MSDGISYDPDHMRSVASQMLTDAQKALDDHNAAWSQMQAHLDSYPAFLQDLLRPIVESHVQRMHSTYHWQVAYANALSNGADQFDLVDQDVAKHFNGGSSGNS